MPSREPSTTCPSPLHFTGSLTCRLGRGRKTNLLPDPGYNVAFFDQHLPRTRRRVLSRFQEKPPSWTPLQKSKMSKSHQKNVVTKNLLLRCSTPVSKISTLKNDLFCFVPRVNSVVFSAPLLRWRKIPK